MFKGEGMKRSVSGTMLMLLLMAMLSLSFNFKSTKAEWTGTVYIRADGSIDPTDAPIITYDNLTYTLTDNIISSTYGIVVEKDNIVLDGASYTIRGTWSRYSEGVNLLERTNVTVRNIQIINFIDGIHLNRSLCNTFTGNNITNNYVGIYFHNSLGNTFTRNNITNNDVSGIYLYYESNYNIIFGNNITNNGYGIYLEGSLNNIIYHNNFVGNTRQVYFSGAGYANVWDDGYPSGGNYWSDYAGVDLFSGSYQNETGSDGIGDMPYTINANNTDRYPLMAPFTAFEAGVYDGIAYNVNVVSNSTVSDFKFSVDQKSISFNVNGTDGTIGFCRITIPNVIVQELWKGNYTVLLNGEPYPFRNWTDSENTYIYINYTHSTHEIAIIPEYPSTIILTIFMLTTTILLILTRNRRLKHRFNHP
jgi:parallel beta-helix repeat protein